MFLIKYLPKYPYFQKPPIPDKIPGYAPDILDWDSKNTWTLYWTRIDFIIYWSEICKVLRLTYLIDTGRKLNVHETFRRRHGRLLNVLYAFNLHPVSTGYWIWIDFVISWTWTWKTIGLTYWIQIDFTITKQGCC